MRSDVGLGWVVVGALVVGCGDDVGTGSAEGSSSTGSGGVETTGQPVTTGDLPTTSGDVTSDGTGDADTGTGTGTSTGDTSTGDDTLTGESSSSGETTGPACPPASEGCPCDVDDVCDDPLVCVEGVCVEPPPAVCGDGVVAGGEVCDDGNPDNTDACLDTCVAAACGDGFLQAGVEGCDDGNLVDDDMCLATCVAASCGDGVVEAGVEVCDDGNDVETDECLAGCVAASCGDGFVQDGVEGCDDGNGVDTDACPGTCVAASCGDGFVQAGVEVCDDGNDIDDDECSNSCKLPTSCQGDQDCLVVASTQTNTVSVLDPVGFGVLASFPGFTSPLSVAAGTDGKLYVGEFDKVRTVDLVSKQVVEIGAGLISGPIYGVTVRAGKVHASGSGNDFIKLLTLAGMDAGKIASPNGQNVRSTAYGPQGDLYLSSFSAGPVQRWSAGLVYVGAFGGGGLATAFGVTTRANGDVLVSGQDQAAYYVYSQVGAFKKKVAVNCGGQLRNIAADNKGRLYVGCYDANKVVVFDAADAAIKEVPISTPSGVAVLTASP